MSCGDCTACCKVFKIIEIKKPAGDLCKNCTNNGCSIYEKRPETCRTYQCAFLVGKWNEKLRPDKCGVIINDTKDGNYTAIRFKDKINPKIMQQIKFIEKKYDIKINGVDGRV